MVVIVIVVVVVVVVAVLVVVVVVAIVVVVIIMVVVVEEVVEPNPEVESKYDEETTSTCAGQTQIFKRIAEGYQKNLLRT